MSLIKTIVTGVLSGAVVLSASGITYAYPSTKVSQSFVETFNLYDKERDVPWIGNSKTHLVSDDSDPNNLYAVLSAENSQSAKMMKCYRRIIAPYIVQLRMKPSESGRFTMALYDVNLHKKELVCVEGGVVCVQGESIFPLKEDGFSFLSLKVKKGGSTLDLYADDILIKADIRLSDPISDTSGIYFAYSAEDASACYVDDVYVYGGETPLDEYQLLTGLNKAIYCTGQSVFLFDHGTVAYSNRIRKEISEKAYRENGVFLVPAEFVLSDLGADIQKSDGQLQASLNGKTHVLGADNAGLLMHNDVPFVSAQALSELYNLSFYTNEYGLAALSLKENLYKEEKDREELTALIMKAMTGFDYQHNSVGQIVKITADLSNLQCVRMAAAVNSDYEPQPENPARCGADGNLITRYSADGTDHYLQLDLGEVKQITGYAIAWYNGSSRKNNYKLSYSENGVDWKSTESLWSTGTTDSYEYIDFPMTARYIRYIGSGTLTNSLPQTAGAWNSISDFAVFGEDTK